MSLKSFEVFAKNDEKSKRMKEWWKKRREKELWDKLWVEG